MDNGKRDDEQDAPRVSRRGFLTRAAAGASLTAAAAALHTPPVAAQRRKRGAKPKVEYGRLPEVSVLSLMTQYQSGDLTIPAYLSLPGKKKSAPAVLVIHEVFGLNDHIKSIAERIASEGYVALAPNFFVRASQNPPPSDATDMQAIRRAASSIPVEAAIKDMQAALDFLKSNKGDLANAGTKVKPRFASIGFCMGGGFSYQLATHTRDLAGAVIFYGRTPVELAPQVSCPLLGNFGAQDRGIPPEQVQAWVEAVTKAGKSVDAKIYPDAGHGFFNDTRAQAYNAAAAADAWQRTLKFFRERLGT
jgi:carboxymethylenebutenolidase